jgi:UDP-N-acetyl-D-glucosamine dehydrogenase
MKISIVGQGYVGLPLAIAASSAGHQVTGIDLNNSIIEKLEAGLSPIGDLSDHEIAQELTSGNYTPTSSFDSISQSEIVIICVPTPLNDEGEPDYQFLLSATSSISEHLQAGTLVINESTVSPGATRELVGKSLDKLGISYDLAYSPERIDPSNKKWGVKNTPKLVAGFTQNATARAENFYDTFVSSVIVGTTPEVVETAKLLENIFRLINISFINEFAQFCSAMKIDVREVISAASTKPYGFMPFYPSSGVGGHCIPVDPSYLAAKAKEIGASTKFIDLANNFNNSLPVYFTGVATGLLGTLKNKKILLVGIAYKPNVSDVRETPAEGLMQSLREAGAEVYWHDNMVQRWHGEDSVELSEKYDLAILVNPHSDTNLQLLGKTPVLDTRGGY